MIRKTILCILLFLLIQKIEGNRFTEKDAPQSDYDWIALILGNEEMRNQYSKYYNDPNIDKVQNVLNILSAAINYDNEEEDIHEKCVNLCIDNGKCDEMTEECKSCILMTTYDYWPECKSKCQEIVDWDGCYKCDDICEKKENCIRQCEHTINDCKANDTNENKHCDQNCKGKQNEKECTEGCENSKKCKKCVRKCNKNENNNYD